MNTTPLSLLDQMRQPERQVAWGRFVALYTPLLRHWAGRVGLHGSDADDLLQDVFVVLVRRLPEFHYDQRQSFRGWLWQVLRNKVRELRKRRSLPLAEAGTPEASAPDGVPELAEAEYRQLLTQRALQVMQSDFQESTWRAFWETVVSERSAADVGAELGLEPAAVYAAKARVLRRLRQELAGLLD